MMYSSNKRISELDVAKGILMLLLIWHHVPQNPGKYGIDFYGISQIDNISYIVYAPFFMCSFFLITGLCSSFEKDQKDFLISNFKTLLIPLIAFGLFFQFLFYISGVFNVVDYNFNFDWLTNEWFLKTLFLSKILYYYLRKYIGSVVLLFVSLFFISGVGCLFNQLNYFSDFLCCQHVMIMTLFIGIGDFCKHKPITNRLLAIMSIMYVGCVPSFYCFSLNIPWITKGINIGCKYYIPFLFMSLCGSALLYLLSRIINHSRFLEYIGKRSIVVYASNYFLTSISCICLHRMFPFSSDYYGTLLFCVIAFSLIVFFSVLTIRVFDIPFLKIFRGKF